MSRSSRAAEAVTQVALEAFSAPATSSIIARVLPGLQDAVGADVAAYYVQDRGGWTAPAYLAPDWAWHVTAAQPISTSVAVSKHPGIRHCVVNQPKAPFALTDLIPERQWRDSEWASVLRPAWGKNLAFAIPVPPEATPGSSHVWVLTRASSDFSASDREVCEALTPVLVAIARHWISLGDIAMDPSVGDVLTQREVVILTLHAQGLSASSAAVRLGISARTAQKHAEHIYRKLGVHNRQDALRVCTELGISTP